MGDDTRISRREFALGSATVAVGAAAATGTVAAQDGGQTGNGTDGGTGADGEGRRAVAYTPGEFEDYSGTYVVVSDLTQNDPQDAFVDCDYATWPNDQTAVYEGSIVENLSGTGEDLENALGVEIYVDESGPEPGLGQPFEVLEVHDCPGEVTGLLLATVPSEFQGDDENETDGNATAGNATATETAANATDGGDGGGTTATDTPGFGVGAAIAGLTGAVAISRLLRDGD